MSMEQWLGKARDFGKFVEARPEPVTFLLGAGCSLSSGAPSTAEVHAALTAATAGRANGENLRDFLHEITPGERRRVLEPLFRNNSPYIGYKLLAALAAIRRVNVLNLNWDDMAERACSEAGVECVAFDLDDRTRWGDAERKLPTGRGLLSVHVHGRLDTTCRYSRVETARFDSAQIEFISSRFLNQPLLIAGASLQGDVDLFKLLQGSPSAAEREHAVWFFGRPRRGGATDGRFSELQQLFNSRAKPREYCVDADVDFDRLMVTILEEAKGQRWSSTVFSSLCVQLPQDEKLISVRPDLLRQQLGEPVVPLIGMPLLGKTVLAHRLGHYFTLASLTAIEVQRIDSPAAAASALGALEVDGDSCNPTVLLIEDPFGSTDHFEDNPEFLEQLGRLLAKARSTADWPHRIVVTSRHDNWETALRQNGGRSGLAILSVSGRPGDWYDREKLKALAAGNDVLEAWVEQGFLRTPGEIIAAAKDESDRNAAFGERPQSDPVLNGSRSTTDLANLFEHAPELGRLYGIVRLQEFCVETFPEDSIYQWAGVDRKLNPFGAHLDRIVFEGIPRIRLDHSCTQEAADIYLGRHLEELRRVLEAALPPRHPLLSATQTWSLLFQERNPGPQKLGRWGPAFFAARPDLMRLELALEAAPDQWGLTEVAYELARLWQTLPAGAQRRAFLQKIANDRRRRGAYALYEACLYLQRAADPEVRAEVEALVWARTADPDATQEAALLIDGWMWRPLLERKLPPWVARYFQTLTENDPAWALVRFLAAYHPESFSQLPHNFWERDRSVNWTDAQAAFAAWLVEWHFVHQSRSRVLLTRLRATDKNFLCRTLHRSIGVSADFGRAQRFVETLASHARYCGWAFHAACNLMCLRPDQAGGIEEVARILPGQVGPSDKGLITTCMTFESTERFRSELRPYFTLPQNWSALFETLCCGIESEGTQVEPPYFHYARPASQILRLIEPKLQKIRRQRLDLDDLPLLAQRIWTVAEPSIAARKITRLEVSEITTAIERGDVRWLEEHLTPARGGGAGDPIEQAWDVFINKVNTPRLLIS